MIAANINWLHVKHWLIGKTLLSALLISSFLSFTTLGSRYYYHHPNFTDEEIEPPNKQLAQSHTAGKWQILDSDLGNLASKPPFSIFQYNYFLFFFTSVLSFSVISEKCGKVNGHVRFINGNSLFSHHTILIDRNIFERRYMIEWRNLVAQNKPYVMVFTQYPQR